MLFRNEGGASLDSHAHETITRPHSRRRSAHGSSASIAPAAATGWWLGREGRERACKGGYKSCFPWFLRVHGNVLLWDEGGRDACDRMKFYCKWNREVGLGGESFH